VDVTLGDIMAHVVVEIGKNHIESVITRRSAEQLALKKGDTVTVVIKSTEVMPPKGLVFHNGQEFAPPADHTPKCGQPR